MTMTIGLILAAIAGFVLGFLFGRLKKPHKTQQIVPKASRESASLPEDLRQLLQALIDSGHKIGALKELQDTTGMGLEEAKKVIDSMEASVPPQNHAEKIGIVRDLIRNGKKSEALKLYRESSGLPLDEAQEVIDKMEAEFG